MKAATLLPLFLLAVALPPGTTARGEAPELVLKADRTRSFIDVEVRTTGRNFTAHLDTYDLRLTAEATGRLKSAVLTFKFSALRTGDKARDADMLRWLGGGDPEGRFELGLIAVAPDGQGQATGKLTFHGQTQYIEFSLEAVRSDDTYTITGETELDYRNWGLKVLRKVLVYKVDPVVLVRFKVTAVPPDTSSLVK